MNSRKSPLFNGRDVWIKKDDDKDFDVTTGSFKEKEQPAYTEMMLSLL